jgi:hypothetical protein
MDKAVKDRQIQKRHLLKLELDYWVGKYKRFQMEEVPEGFARRQGAGIGLVGKYAGLYLKSLFHKADDRSKSNVRVVKGTTTAEYRKMWGIQDEYEKKSRDNHVHHCIDAITIACIEPGEYNATAKYYQQLEEYERTKAAKPSFPKPWATFTEDIKAIAQEMLVVHSTPDNMPKRARKYVQTSQGKKLAMGDSARGSLHNDTYYGAIERDGDIRYVVRKSVDMLEAKDALPVSQFQPDASAEIIASLKREMVAKDESFRLQLEAKDEIIARSDKQLADKDLIIEKSEQTIKALQDQIFDLRHLLAQKMTKDELSNYPFVIGVADDSKKSRNRI